MKDVFKRIIIIALFLFLICGTIYIANKKINEKDEDVSNINVKNTTVV